MPMGERNISKKDEIILQQLDVIRTMTENNLSRMKTDFWSAPAEVDTPVIPAAPEQGPAAPGAASTGDDDTKAPPAQAEPPAESMEDLQEELEGYIGLAAVKQEVRNLINMVTVHRLRRDNDLPAGALSLHMVFSGNPGTGKTTIARLMARIYHALGILSRGQLVEVDRSGLVAGYVGQTALKTSKVIDSALGGVLFIDEAYALNGRAENDFGQEAIDTLLKAMEDHREDLVVIVAGYDALMETFIHSNPGLESRFNRFLRFEDYTPEELLEIFRMQCRKGCYELNQEAEACVQTFIREENTHAMSFGNARGVRNLFERILTHQANRLAELAQVSRENLMKILPDDVLAAQGLTACDEETPQGKEEERT